MSVEEQADTVLSLLNVSRVYPRDISDTPSAMLREMFLPRTLLKHAGPEEFFALRGINLELKKGQKLGVIGAHRSGKTTLAGVVSGVLLPTDGRVIAHGSRLLISRPTAGFKPTLTVFENLAFRATLTGLCGRDLIEIIDITLSRCGVSHAESKTPIGNLSPYIVKQLGMTLLLEMPADILIIDELSGAGAGGARWETRGRLQERIELGTALILSEDTSFLEDVTNELVLLYGGRLYGPFEITEAIELFNQLPEEDSVLRNEICDYDPLTPPSTKSESHGDASMALQLDDDLIISDHSEQENEIEGEETREYNQKSGQKRKKNAYLPWEILKIKVDGEEFKHSQSSLLRWQDSTINVCVEMTAIWEHEFSGGIFLLHGGNSGLNVAHAVFKCPNVLVRANEKAILKFDFKVTNSREYFYGVSFYPVFNIIQTSKENRIKILIFGVSLKHLTRNAEAMTINNSSFVLRH